VFEAETATNAAYNEQSGAKNRGIYLYVNSVIYIEIDTHPCQRLIAVRQKIDLSNLWPHKIRRKCQQADNPKVVEPSSPPQSKHMLEILTEAALAAGRAILEVHKAGPHVSYKGDCSPVTEADQRAEAIILAALAVSFPDIPVIAEESVAAGILPDTSGQDFFLVDPLDGTKEFIGGYDDFTVNIALIRDGRPVLGVVLAPSRQIAWTGDGKTAKKLLLTEKLDIIERHPIHTRGLPAAPIALISRAHCTAETEAFVAEKGILNFISIGSSLKFCMLAEGNADIYPRFSRTMLWDTAAGDAVLRAAGGITLDPSGNALTYHVRECTIDGLANSNFVAWGQAPQ
jgi:3'(2'), 5'-bisphosphate nucleotidase